MGVWTWAAGLIGVFCAVGRLTYACDGFVSRVDRPVYVRRRRSSGISYFAFGAIVYVCFGVAVRCSSAHRGLRWAEMDGRRCSFCRSMGRAVFTSDVSVLNRALIFGRGLRSR